MANSRDAAGNLCVRRVDYRGICSQPHGVSLDVSRVNVRRGRPPAGKETSSIVVEQNTH